MRTTHRWDHKSAVIRVEGLKRPVRALHIADVHMGLIDERDSEHVEICQGLGERFHPRYPPLPRRRRKPLVGAIYGWTRLRGRIQTDRMAAIVARIAYLIRTSLPFSAEV